MADTGLVYLSKGLNLGTLRKTAGAVFIFDGIVTFFFFFFFWDWGLNFALTKWVLYHLSHTSSPFCSGYFGGGVLPTIHPKLASNCDPLHLSLPSR
jgi:hypothetical protein